MRRIGYIFVREYLENVRTKAFLIGIVLTPLWFGLVFLAPFLAEKQEPELQVVSIVDRTGVLAGELATVLGRETTRKGRALYQIEIVAPANAGEDEVDRLRQEAVEGKRLVVLLAPPVLEKREPGEGEEESVILHAASASAFETGHVLQGAVNDAVNRHIMEVRGIAAEDVALLQRQAVKAKPLSRGGEEAGIAQLVTPLIFMLFLFMGIVGMGQMLVNSTIEEKASRVYEVLLSSVSPFQLMAGKLLGICAVGFTLVVFWTGGGMLAAALQGMSGLVTGGQIGLFVAYYVLGFLMIASGMVAIGSACNTLKEAQNLMAPVSMLLALPMLLAVVVLKTPHGVVATVGSFLPPFTPFVMMARIGAVPAPPAWQIWASLLLLVLATWITVRLAAKIFRAGILMYGQPPSLGEILRWLRQS